MKSFGVLNRTEIADELDNHIEELSINGFSVIENLLDADEIGLFKKKLDEVYAEQVKELSEEKLKSINELYIARVLLAYDDYFIELIKKEKLLNLLRRLLGEYFILHLQNGIINMPKQTHHQNSWHRDLPYQDFIISKSLAFSALYCLDDFTEATGGTIVVPYTHKVDKMPSNQYMEKHSKQIVAKAGSVIVFDSMVFHRAGYNSSDRVHRGINHMFTSAILKQQVNIPMALGGKYKDDPFLKMLLGYETSPVNNVVEWRTKKLNSNK